MHSLRSFANFYIVPINRATKTLLLFNVRIEVLKTSIFMAYEKVALKNPIKFELDSRATTSTKIPYYPMHVLIWVTHYQTRCKFGGYARITSTCRSRHLVPVILNIHGIRG